MTRYWWFQSTRPRGARLKTGVAAEAEFKFQSTRPRGARLACWTTAMFPLQFQSTRPRGARPEHNVVAVDVRVVSIHAPARGAT